MYNYIKTDNPPLEDLKQVGMDLVLDIVKMLPEEFEGNIVKMRDAIPEYNYEVIERGAHSIKSNLKIFMDENSSAVEFCYGFEKRAKEAKLLKASGDLESDIDFTADLGKLVEITTEPLNEIKRYGEEVENS